MKRTNSASIRSSERIRVALLSPYTGGNLGDAAIQEAVISNIKTRWGDPDICLMSYAPDVTSRLHCIRSFPLCTTMYSSAALKEYAYSSAMGTAVEARMTFFDKAKREFKQRFPILRTLKRIVLSITPRFVQTIAYDVLHTLKAYKLARGMDLIVVSGGGQLDDYFGGPWRHPYSLLKWGMIARLVGARYLFLSVGVGSIESRLTRVFLRHALRLAAYRSYRDQKSKELLQYMGFTRDDPVCPDLAFSFDYESDVSSNTRRARIVGISPISYLSRRWDEETNLAVYERYIESLASLVRRLTELGYQIVLFSTDAADAESLDDLEAAVARKLEADLASRVSRLNTGTLDTLSRCLGKLAFVVASRLHGVLLSHRAGLPVLAISYDRKVATHMSETELSEYCLDFQSIETSVLLSAFVLMVQNADSIRSRLKEINTRYSGTLMLQYDRVVGTST